jgi:hypothetical protein
VTISTTAPVTIENSRIKNMTVADGNPKLVYTSIDGADVTITNCRFYGGCARAVYCEGGASGFGIKNLTVRNCTISRTSGITIVYGQTTGTFLITKNAFTDIQDNGLLTPGWSNNEAGNMVQLRETSATCTMSWNQVINTYNDSWPEDIISLFKAKNVTVSDNYLQHQSTPGNAYNTSSQGSITVDGDAAAPYPENIDVLRNQIVDCVNGGYITGYATDVLFSENRIIQDGKLPDGVTQMGNGYSGMAIISGATACHMHDNVIGYVNRDNARTDWDDNLYAPEGRTAEIALNTTLGDPVTQAMEQAEWTTWQTKVVSNAITVGSSL